MELKLISKEKNSIELSLKDVDISLLQVLQEILLGDKRILNASVKRVHPLTRENLLYLMTDGSDPKTVLKEALDKAYDLAEGLKADLMSALD